MLYNFEPDYIRKKRTEKGTELYFNLAGFDREEISLEQVKDTLEVRYGKNKYSVYLSNEFDISAKYKNGLLTVLLEDLEKEKRKIEIK